MGGRHTCRWPSAGPTAASRWTASGSSALTRSCAASPPAGRRAGSAGVASRCPYSPNARRVTGAAGKRSQAGEVAWFRTAFTVRRGGDHAIRFESVHHRARVWVDGRQVARHTGAYLPFEARVRLAAGRHVLVVRADWRSPDAMKADAWNRSWFNFGGIDREVTLRRLRPSELDAPGVRTRLSPDGSAVVTVTGRLRNRAPRPRTLRVAGSLGGAPLRFAPVRLGPGRAAWLHARIRLARPALWSTEHPRLLRLRLAVPGEAGLGARVGLRELRWSGGRLRLNGRPLVLRGASVHEDAAGRGDALHPADMDAVVARLRAIGANATRAQHPLAPALLERLDAAGILVWQGIGPVDSPGAWTSTTPARRARAERRVRLSVLQLRTHPSVVAWNLANEVACNGHSGGQAPTSPRAARDVRRLDPGRPVALDLWGTHLPSVAGADLAPRRRGRRDELPGLVRAAGRAGGGDARGDRGVPGAGCTASSPTRSSPSPSSAPRPTARTPRRRPAASATRRGCWPSTSPPTAPTRGSTAMLVWNLQDFALTPRFAGGSIRRELPDIRLRRGINQKGLFTYGGEPKPAAAAVARAFRR